MDKTHIDNTIEEILGRYTSDYIATSVGSRPIIAEGLVAELSELIQSESKRYADERVMEFAESLQGLGDYIVQVSNAEVMALAEEFLNQNTESEKEDTK